MRRIGLMVADGIAGLDAVVGRRFPGTPLQCCVTHLKRNTLARVRQGDRAALADDLRDVFMIYTTNWIERLNRDFRRVTRMRAAMPNEESVITLMGSVAMESKAFDRGLPRTTTDRTLFPGR